MGPEGSPVVSLLKCPGLPFRYMTSDQCYWPVGVGGSLSTGGGRSLEEVSLRTRKNKGEILNFPSSIWG